MLSRKGLRSAEDSPREKKREVPLLALSYRNFTRSPALLEEQKAR